jgi:D-inositol-3-phosphate glycosyltransferase
MPDRLRIAMLSAHSCPVGDLGAKDTGGMSVYIRELACGLGKQGHDVDIYTRVHNPIDPRVEELVEGVRLIHLKAGREANIHKMDVYFSLPEFTFNLENFWKDNGLHYDVVFSHYWLSALVGKYLQEKWPVPYAAMYHTLGAVKNTIGIGESDPELRIVSERETVQDCRRIIAATEKERQDIIRYYGASPGKIAVVPCGVNMDLFRPLDRRVARDELGLSGEKILLFVGRIDPLKGIDRLIKALLYLPSREGLKLVIIGGDEGSRAEVEKLKKLSIEMNIADSVVFRGLVEHGQLPYYYSAADVCIVPSYYESFGLVALESLACGTPVVASDVGDLRNIIRPGETGYVEADNAPEKIAGGIARVLSAPDRDRESVLAVRASVSRFDWSHIAATIAGEMRTVTEGRVTAAA